MAWTLLTFDKGVQAKYSGQLFPFTGGQRHGSKVPDRRTSTLSHGRVVKGYTKKFDCNTFHLHLRQAPTGEGILRKYTLT